MTGSKGASPPSTADRVEFPADFLWGAATSAYQIEGSPLADGAGPSIWHRFAHTPGRTANGDNGDVACDHYRRWADDIALMRELGLQSYRLSIAWGRVLPEGTGRVNPAGLAFYERLIDGLLAAGIAPNVTLYHWDLPAALDDRGGWLNPDSVNWFAEYAQVMFRALGDRVPMWATLNEPWVSVDGGYLYGVHAPGHRNLYEAPRAAHHLMCAHGAAVEAYRALARQKIGLVVNIEPKYSASDDPADLAATRRADAYMNRQYLDPIFLGAYPAELAEVYGDAWFEHAAEDMARIGRWVDYIGINYYTRSVNRHDPANWPVGASPVRQPNRLYTETGWEVHPESLTRLLLWFRERYHDVPLYITENGAAFHDPAVAGPEGIQDELRVDYYRQHLRALHAALKMGVNVRGYYAWSLMDNCEWAAGYARRFGLVHVDYATQRRTIKASGRFYREVIASRGAVLNDPPA